MNHPLIKFTVDRFFIFLGTDVNYVSKRRTKANYTVGTLCLSGFKGSIYYVEATEELAFKPLVAHWKSLVVQIKAREHLKAGSH